LINKVLLNSDSPSQKKTRAPHGGGGSSPPSPAAHLAFRHCHGGRHAPRLPGQASFTAEFVRPQDCDDGFFALLGDNGDFDLALLDVENCIRRTALRKDRLVLSILDMVRPMLSVSRKTLGSNGSFRLLFI
jgi:hypothetical protein